MDRITPHLLLIVDVNPITWGSYGSKEEKRLSPTLPFPMFFEQIMTFISSYLLCGDGSITILCCAPHGCAFIPITTNAHCTIQNMKTIRSQFLQFVKTQAVECKKNPLECSPLAGSLSKGMCCLIL